MKVKKFFFSYGYAYLCYYALGNFLISALPILMAFTTKIRRIKISKTYFFLIVYMFVVSSWSFLQFETRNFSNLIASQKVYIFVVCYILIYSAHRIISVRDLCIMSSRFMITFLPIANIISLTGANIHIFGLRGDVGILLCFLHFFSSVDKLFLRKNGILYIIELVLLVNILLFLEGRTAFGVLSICVVFVFYVKRKTFDKKSLLDGVLIVVLTAGVLFAGVFLFNARGGVEYVQTGEARTLALFYWYDVMTETSWQKVFFGHGYGTCVDQIVGSNIFSQMHINQIKASSGQDCYVSWGFHNTILSLIYELGIAFLFLLIFHLNKIRKFLSPRQRSGFWFLISMIIVASPNNHFVNHDIIGFVIFSGLAYLERLGAQQNV